MIVFIVLHAVTVFILLVWTLIGTHKHKRRRAKMTVLMDLMRDSRARYIALLEKTIKAESKAEKRLFENMAKDERKGLIELGKEFDKLYRL